MAEKVNRGGTTAAQAGVAGCHQCGKLTADGNSRCRRCGARVFFRKPHSIQRTWALLITAILLYIPAMTLPIMDTSILGETIASTIVGGTILLWQENSYAVAVTVFLASVFVPVAKFAIILLLLLTVRSRGEWRARDRVVLHRIIDFIGRWSMLDIFVVAILVALVQMGVFATIVPNAGAAAFAASVVVTMLAARSFDVRLIFDHMGERQ